MKFLSLEGLTTFWTRLKATFLRFDVSNQGLTEDQQDNAILNLGLGIVDNGSMCDQIGAVKKEGDTMTGNLNISTSLYPSLYLMPTSNSTTNRTVFEGSYVGASSFSAEEDSTRNNRRMLEVRTKNYKSNLQEAVALRTCENGTWNEYDVVHSGWTGANVASQFNLAQLDSNGKILATQATSTPEAFSTAKTLAATDNGKFLYKSTTTNLTITLPVSLPLGFECEVHNGSAGTVTFAISGSGTLRMPGGASTSPKMTEAYGVTAIKKITSTDFILTGSVEAS